MKAKFGIGITFYNDYGNLKRLLESVKEGEKLKVIDGIIAIDGRYPSFKDDNMDHGLSTDGSRELLLRHRNTRIIDMANRTQIDQRNKYLSMSRSLGYNFLIIADSDEYFVKMDWLTFRYAAIQQVKADKFMYRIYDVRSDGDPFNIGERPRLWFRPWEVRYEIRHFRWRILAKEHLDRPVYEGECGHALIPGCTLRHDHALRTQERTQIMGAYEDWLINEEVKQMKNKYNLPS